MSATGARRAGPGAGQTRVEPAPSRTRPTRSPAGAARDEAVPLRRLHGTRPARSPLVKDPDRRVSEEVIEVTGGLERHAVEALEIKLRRLARRHGVELRQVRVERDDGPAGGGLRGRPPARARRSFPAR